MAFQKYFIYLFIYFLLFFYVCCKNLNIFPNYFGQLFKPIFFVQNIFRKINLNPH